ncbi:MAG: hypothetical protein LKE39_03035 [Sphaerochaeta sp.]|jgi:aldose 1-epimerase|nr:hypothetical protein [Sphaerochaeta sp.]
MNRLENEALSIDLTPFSAAIHRITVKATGRQIVYPLAQEEDHIHDASYANDTIGCYVGRIKNSLVSLDGKSCHLDANDGEHSIHGGKRGLSQKKWTVVQAVKEGVVYRTTLSDGEDGLPGNRTFTTTYQLLSDGLSICYLATSDKTTFLDLTNHLYLNLSGDFSQNIQDHFLQMDAPFVWLNDKNHLPQQCISTKNTLFDFSVGKTLASVIHNPLLSFSQGLNNAFLWNHQAILWYNDTKVVLHSDTPSLVIYSGGYLPHPSTAIALEAQLVPNTLNLRQDRSIFLQTGQVWERMITLHIHAKKQDGILENNRRADNWTNKENCITLTT